MKKLTLKSIIFLVISFFILNIVGYLIIEHDKLSKNLSWYHILSAIKKSKNLNLKKGNVIILGDSVANQIFNSKIKPYSLTTNGSVTMIGHYILAYNAIKRNPSIKYIVLASIPYAIGNNFERKRTYSNFMKPFFCFENLPHFSKLVFKKLNKKRISYFSIFPFIKTARFFSDLNFSNEVKKNPFLSDIAIEYLKKLHILCLEKGIKLIVVSPPVSKQVKKNNKNWKKLKNKINKNRLNNIFKGYIKSIMIFDKKHFRDNIHLSVNFLKKNRRKIIFHMLPIEVINNIPNI